VESNAADPLGDQREDDVAAIAVAEPLASRELGRMPVEHRQVLLGCGKILGRHGEHIVGDLVAGLLIKVVTDTRPVRQQMLDRDVTADEREIPAQHRTRGRRHAQRIVLDQADHRQCGQPFGSAGDREPGTDRVRYLVCPVSEPVRPDELDLTAAVHGHDASEPIPGGNRVDYL